MSLFPVYTYSDEYALISHQTIETSTKATVFAWLKRLVLVFVNIAMLLLL
jgi:hypothetical protein